MASLGQSLELGEETEHTLSKNIANILSSSPRAFLEKKMQL
jgi:hypothetical protein